MKKLFITGILFTFVLGSSAQLIENADMDTLCGHPTHWDSEGRILSWYKPEVPGAGYAHVAGLASEFIRSGTPIDPKTGKKLYYISCCFQGPHMRSLEDFDNGVTWEEWMHNPACVWAGLVQGMVLDYRVFSGENSYLEVVGEMLDYQLGHGTTPAGWPWASCPYASSDPGDTLYQGATRWESDGMRGDGLHGIEPDKVGELGIAYLLFYEATEEKIYLEAAIHCADALAKHVRDVRPPQKPFVASKTAQSPWPFRVNARTGVVLSEYCSNVIEPIRLLDELLRLADRLSLEQDRTDSYKKARDIAWEWLYSINGPMKTYIWNNYFEDIPNDPDRTNRVQITPLETARYLLNHPGQDPALDVNAPALIHWVSSAFATEGMDAIREQTWCYEPMGSHTARYASLCAMIYERTGEPWYRDQAYRFFNFATYMCHENGVVVVGPHWPGSWFSDGYGDYIRHFVTGLAAVPEWAPADEDHLLKSSSVVQQIDYSESKLNYRTFDKQAVEVLRLTSEPKKVTVNGETMPRRRRLKGDCWSWNPLNRGGVLRIRHAKGADISIFK